MVGNPSTDGFQPLEALLQTVESSCIFAKRHAYSDPHSAGYVIARFNQTGGVA